MDNEVSVVFSAGEVCEKEGHYIALMENHEDYGEAKHCVLCGQKYYWANASQGWVHPFHVNALKDISKESRIFQTNPSLNKYKRR